MNCDASSQLEGWCTGRSSSESPEPPLKTLPRHSKVALQLPRSTFRATVELLTGMAMIKAATRENQVKLTVSVPPSLHVLLRSWALCEGRELTSVVLQCVELSIRQLKSNGSIPSAAVRAYEGACDERLAMGGL